MRRGTCLLMLLLSVVASPSRADAIDRFTLEGGVGVAVPLNTFFDLHDTNGNPVFTAKTRPGPSLAISLLLNDVELRWGMNTYRIVDVQSSLSYSAEIDQVVSTLEKTGGCELLDCEAIQNTLQAPSDGFIFVNSLTAGYRFYLHRADWQFYIPVGLGSVVAAGDNAAIEKFLFGFGAQTGFGFDSKITDRWSWFASLRYHLSLVETPTRIAASGVTVGQNGFESSTVLFHALGINAGVLGRW
jgi:outer membrane protein with beta-barrel domain